MSRGILLAFILALSAAAWCESCPPVGPAVPINPAYEIALTVTGAHFNWSTGQLEAVGLGYAPGGDLEAMQHARSVAVMQMVQEARRIFPSLAVDGIGTLQGAMTDANKAAIDAIFTAVSVVDERWNAATHIYTVVGIVPLFGEHGVAPIAVKLLPDTATQRLSMDELNMLRPVPRGHSPQVAEPPYTGVIVNGDLALLKPCLFPRIYRFDGLEIYGPSAPAADILPYGPVRYVRNLDEALAQKVAGDKPLILEAIGTAKGGLYPVINLDDAYRAVRAQRDEKLLERQPLVITLGQK
jgi:hypothetical protein